MKKRLIFLGFLLFIISTNAQQNDSLVRPKIGLVLSGGGAKGLAHIGVLKVLEKHHIRPDYIAGTSMGAIVGGYYAAGYSASQIDSIFRKLSFDDIMYNRFDRKYKYFFSKEHGKKYIISLPFSTHKMSAELPRGLNDSQQFFMALADGLLPVSNIEDFNNLQTPFICMATDIVNGKQVLFNHGYLAESIISSALLPSVYNPIEVNGKLLMDGGIVNNYPVKEVKDLGADIVIGSDVQGSILQKHQITDLPAIMDQIVSFNMYKKMPIKKALTDIYLHPNIKGIGITDFDRIDTIIHRGEIAMESKLKKIKNLQTLQSDKPINHLHYQKPDSLSFNEIIINGQNRFKREYILGKIDIKINQKISYKDFIDGINNLYGTENFEKVHYRFRNENSKLKLYLNIKEHRYKASMNLGFHYNDLYKINVIANLENRHVLFKNDLLSSDIIGGNQFRYNLDYIIDNGFKLSLGLHSSLHQISHQVISNDIFPNEHFSVNKLDFNYLKITNKIYFQGNLSHFLYIRIGAQQEFKRLYTYVFSGQQQEQNAYYFGNNHYFGGFASIHLDSRDNFVFPTKGVYLKLKWNYTPFSTDFYQDFKTFSQYIFDLSYTQKLFSHTYLHTKIKTGLHDAKHHNVENIFYLGGANQYLNFDNIIDYKPAPVLSFSATKYFLPEVILDIEPIKNHHIFFGGHALYYDTSDALIALQPKNIYGYSIGYGFNSFLGPIKLNFGALPRLHKNAFSFTFGYNF